MPETQIEYVNKVGNERHQQKTNPAPARNELALSFHEVCEQNDELSTIKHN